MALPKYELSASPTIWVAAGGQPAACLDISDQLRDGAAQAMTQLHRRGLQVTLLLGDRRAVTEEAGRQVGVDEVIAEVLPAGTRWTW